MTRNNRRSLNSMGWRNKICSCIYSSGSFF